MPWLAPLGPLDSFLVHGNPCLMLCFLGLQEVEAMTVAMEAEAAASLGQSGLVVAAASAGQAGPEGQVGPEQILEELDMFRLREPPGCRCQGCQ